MVLHSSRTAFLLASGLTASGGPTEQQRLGPSSQMDATTRIERSEVEARLTGRRLAVSSVLTETGEEACATPLQLAISTELSVTTS